MNNRRLKTEALLILENEGAILRTAREVSQLMQAARINAAVVGGVAVVLHGHVRTTLDVDVFVPDPAAAATALRGAGFEFEASPKQFVKQDVPVHLVLLDQIKVAPKRLEQIDGVQTVSLCDLIDMKLRSGTSNVVRSQDLADVIGLIRDRDLKSAYARNLDKAVAADFRRLVKAVREAT